MLDDLVADGSLNVVLARPPVAPWQAVGCHGWVGVTGEALTRSV